MEPDFMLDFDMSSLSMSNDLDALFFSPEAHALQDLLEVESMLLQEEGHNDSTVAGTPLRASRDAAPPPPVRVRQLQPAREQCYSVLLGGAALSRPAVCGAAIAFGTESENGPNRLVLVDSIARPAGQSRIVPVAGAVTALAFVGSEEHVCFGRSGGGLALLRNADGAEPAYLDAWHADDVRDLALLRGSHRHQLASCSFDGTVCLCDVLQGLPLLRMDLRTAASSVAAHPRHPQVLSCTVDAGALVLRDLRVGRVANSKHSTQPLAGLTDRFEQTGGLLDHVWTGDYECVLAYGNGSLARLDSRTGRMLSLVQCEEKQLDSVEYHDTSATLAVFGTGCTLFSLMADASPVECARYRPRFDRASRNAGAFGASDQPTLFVTAPDSSLVKLEP